MPERNPKLILEPNIPRTIRVDKRFDSGQNKYGAWFAYDVREGDQQYTLFANQAQNNVLASAVGSIVQLTQNTDKDWVVDNGHGKALFDEAGEATPEPKVNPLDDKEAMDSIRADRKDLLQQILKDTFDVVYTHNENVLAGSRPSELYALDHADIRAIALTVWIDYQRRHG